MSACEWTNQQADLQGDSQDPLFPRDQKEEEETPLRRSSEKKKKQLKYIHTSPEQNASREDGYVARNIC